ncbi:hypothetical protein DYH10_02970 [Candidatus Saccharibacteria bacterium CPR2]|nr:hypothetical protein [Candidatus Saccharibacteria bacterium CPR2]
MSEQLEDPAEEQNKELIKQVKDMPDSPNRSQFNSVALPSSNVNKRFLITQKIKVFLYVTIALLVVAVITGSVLIMRHEDPVARGALEAVGSKINAKISSVDGTVETSTDGQNWQAAKTDQDVQSSTYIRTLEQSRAELKLEDKSLLRLNYNTQLKITNLSSTKLRFENLGGEVWARAAQSGHRQFEVALESIRFLSTEAAFISVNSKNTIGVEVYQGKVDVPDPFNETVNEGKAFYLLSSKNEQQKVLDINLDESRANDFIKWNIEKDANNSDFRDKQGISEAI